MGNYNKRHKTNLEELRRIDSGVLNRYRKEVLRLDNFRYLKDLSSGLLFRIGMVNDEYVIDREITGHKGFNGIQGIDWKRLLNLKDGLSVSEFIDVGIFTDGNEPAHQKGRLFYSDEKEAISYYVDNEYLEMNIGRELYMRVKNKQGVTINNGDVVYVSGSSGTNPQVKLAKADFGVTSRGVGIVTQPSILNNGVGYITTYGRVHNIDTSAYSEGDVLYVSDVTAGSFTITKPIYPSEVYRVGIVVVSHANKGSIFVDTDPLIDTTRTFHQEPLSSDPVDPVDGHSVQWVSDGTGSGGVGDVMMKINVGGTVKTITLVDYSAE